MLAFYVDFNSRERFPDGSQAVAIMIGRMNPPSLEERLRVGLRVIVYDEETRGEGILRHGKWIDGWVADLIPETIKDFPKSEFARLRAATRRAALDVVK